MVEFISFILSNFTLSLFVLGLIPIIFVVWRGSRLKPTHFSSERILAYFIFFNSGLNNLYNFVMHVFYGDMAAKFIGWEQSPFQLEVGFASLGFAVIGLMCISVKNLGFRTATVLCPTFFLWGAAGGHIYQMITNDNFSPGNAGIIFWTDIFLPIIGLVLLIIQWRCSKSRPPF